MLVKLFITLVHPTLEYGNSVWEPAFIMVKEKLRKYNVVKYNKTNK